MNNKLLLFSKTFYQNRAVIQARSFSIISIALIFFVVVIMSSFPLYYARVSMSGDELIERFPNINATFAEIYEEELPIRIDESGAINVYDDIDLKRIGDYDLHFEYIDDESENRIIFDEYGIKIIYVDAETDQVRKITGDYNLLRGTDFGAIKEDKPDNLSTEDYYETMTKSILHSIHYSMLTRDFAQITLVQASQFIMFVLVISLLFMFNNISKSSGRLTYLASVKITVISGLTPAILTALIGVYSQSIGSIAFTILYAIRLVFVYRVLSKEGIDLHHNID
ncbi:hypothetical protein [Haloplasma contractile]|uniref:DUF1189 domain-containing protein n=1 Tax=Haloplasma contractile SSD-17B TaxID=1033810 RepID=U2EEN9_9MOLU|nr:hypothetical protein [Haloplasma contractile]ERJ13166.1 hypothetical protein HLPCO_000785 [Haloplasma contractile SSD-17B]